MFLDNRLDLDSFEDWFVQNTWNVHQSGSSAAEDLTFAVEESIAEYSSRHISESELKAELSQLLERDNVIVVIADAYRPIQRFITSSRSVFEPVRA